MKTAAFNKRDCAALAAPLLLLLILRGYGLPTWLLANPDEVALLNQTAAPLFSAADSASCYFPLALLNKLLRWLPFPFLRALSLCAHGAALYLLYCFARPHCGRLRAGLLGTAFAASWYFCYTGRLYTGESFTPLFAIVHFWCLAGWIERRSLPALLTAFVPLGLGLATHSPPWLPYCVFLWFSLALEAWSGRLSWRSFAAAAGICLGCCLPYLYGLTIRQAPIGAEAALLINFFEAQNFLKPLTSIFSLQQQDSYRSGPAVWAAVVFYIPLLLHSLPRANQSKLKRFFLNAAAGQFVLILCWPFPAAREGDLALLLLTVLLLCAFPVRSRLPQAGLHGVLCSFLIGGLLFFQQHIYSNNQHRVVQGLIQETDGNLDHMLISDGAYRKLKYSLFEKLPPEERLKIAGCGSVEDFRTHGSPRHFAAVLISSECEPLFDPYRRAFRKRWELVQTLDSSGRHGVSLYAHNAHQR